MFTRLGSISTHRRAGRNRAGHRGGADLHHRRLFVEALENRYLLSGISSISPSSADQGATDLAVTIDLSTSARPPIPPALTPLQSVTIGTIAGLR